VHDTQASGLRLSVAELIGHPGEFRELSFKRSLPGVGNALARLSEDALEVDLRVETVIEGVLVTGRVEGEASLQCARCLTDLSEPVSLRICELFAAPGHGADDEDDVYRVEVDEIDLDPMLRDALTLALPLNPLCSEECRGLCARCGKDLNTGPCDCTDDDTDPRWGALADLRAKLEQ